VCTRQLCAYNDELAQFRALDAEVVGISAQGLDSHERFAGRHGFGFPLLADEDKRVARAYGILGPFGLPRRSVFVVDAAGRITYAHRALAGLTYRPVAELVAAIADARGVQR
jgi:peroxiredoxin Q/BCP